MPTSPETEQLLEKCASAIIWRDEQSDDYLSRDEVKQILRTELKSLLEDREKFAVRMHKQIDELLAHCGNCECDTCAKIICPFKDDMHFHHDGCPSCCNVPASVICPDLITDQRISHTISTAMTKK